MLAAAAASGAGPLSALATTATTTVGTTTPEPMIAAGVSIGGVPVGGLTSADAYEAVDQSFSQPLTIVVRSHRLSPPPRPLRGGGPTSPPGPPARRARPGRPRR